MKLTLPLTLLSIILSAMTLQDSRAEEPNLIKETITWTEGSAYNKCTALTNGKSYEYTFTGSSGDTFSFTGLDAGIFYWKPNDEGDISLIGVDKMLNLSFDKNSLSILTHSKVDREKSSGSILHLYKGNATFSNFNKLSVTNNTSAGQGGAFYFYGGPNGLLTFGKIDSIEFKNNQSAKEGGAIGGVYANVKFSDIASNITFTENVSGVGGGTGSASVIWSYGGTVEFSDIGGKILVTNNKDASYYSAIQGKTVLFKNVKGGIVFKDNQSRAIAAATSVTFQAIKGGILFDGHSSGSVEGRQQGGTIATSGGEDKLSIVFQDIEGGIILRNSIGCTGAGISDVNAGDILFNGITGDILFEHNVVISGPAAAIRAGNLTMSNITGNLTFSDNKTAEDSASANYGGAIHASGTKEGVLITKISGNVIFKDNAATSTERNVRGGAIYSNGKTTITDIGGNIEFTNNEADASVATGGDGAIYSKKLVQLEAAGRILFSGNKAKGGGGAIYALEEIMMSAGEKGILFDKNSAGGDGGAIYASSLDMTAGKGGILFENNSSKKQGGALNMGKSLTLNAFGGDILFSGNTDNYGDNDVHICQSYGATPSSVTLNAAADRAIIFQGAMSMAHSANIMINTGEESTGMVEFLSTRGIIGTVSDNGGVHNLTIGGGTAIISSMQGQGVVTLSSFATLISGFTSLVVGADGSKSLQTTTGFDKGSFTFSIADGAKLGSNIFNTSDEEVWNINIDDLKASQALAWKDIKGAEKALFGSVHLQGNVVLSNAQLDKNDTLIVGEGAKASLSGELSGNIVLQGGIVDASEMSSLSVDGDKIHGASGSLITKDTQKITYLEDGALGYDVLGYDVLGLDTHSGASIQVGGGDNKVPVITTGGRWNSDLIEVKSGTMIALESALIGSDNSLSTMTVFSGASFENQGANVKNTLILQENAQLSGSGTYNKIQLEDGSRINIGHGKESGFLIVDSIQKRAANRNMFMRAPLAHDDTTLGFMVDGGTAASLGNTGAGTYSHITAKTIDMTGISVEITLGDHLANSDSRDFSMSLIKGETVIGIEGNALQDFILQGRSDLVEDGSIILSWNGNNLVFSGTLNSSAIAHILNPEGSRLANVLWSGTRSLSTFSQLAASQLESLHVGATNIWGSGFGDFTSASNDGDIAGFNYQGGGYATGIDHGFKLNSKDTLTAGFAFGQSFGSHQSNDDLLSVHQRGVMVDLYSRYANKISEKQSWNMTGSFAYGNVDNWGNIGLSADNGAPRHTWNSEAFVADLMFRWNSKVSDTSTLTPFLGMSYLYGSQDNITVQGTTSERHFSESSLQRWVVPVGVEYSRLTTLGNGQKLLSFISLAYQGDIARNDASVKMNILGDLTKVQGTQPGRSAFVLSTGCQWAITPKWTAAANYNLEVRSKMTQQAVTGTVSYSF